MNKQTLKELRNQFWESNPDFKRLPKARDKQNNYNCTIRSAWVDFIDMGARNGDISEELARSATL